VAVCVLNDKPNTMAAEFTINRARQVAVVDRIAEKGVKKSRSVRHPGKFYAGIQGDRRSHRFRPAAHRNDDSGFVRDSLHGP